MAADDYKQFLDPSEFIANAAISSRHGLSKKHLFVAEIPDMIPSIMEGMSTFDLTWNALSASVPGVDLGISCTIINQRPRYYGTERADQDLQITYLESSDMPIRRLFDRWIGLIWDPFTGIRNYPDDYTVESLKVSSLNGQGEQAYFDEFTRVFPYNVADLDWETGSHDLVATVVKFKFSVHTIKAFGDEKKIDY